MGANRKKKSVFICRDEFEVEIPIDDIEMRDVLTQNCLNLHNKRENSISNASKSNNSSINQTNMGTKEKEGIKESQVNGNETYCETFVNSVKKEDFLRKLLEIFTLKQEIILRHTKEEKIKNLSFYSPTSRSGTGLKHGYPPLDDFISLRNLATLLGVNKNNLIALSNQFSVILKIEKSLIEYDAKSKEKLKELIQTFNEFVSDIELDYSTYKIFRKYSTKKFEIIEICKLLQLSENTIYRDASLATIFSRLLNIYFLSNEVDKIGINPNSLDKLKKESYNECLKFLISNGTIKKEEPGSDNFRLVFLSLLVLNENNGGKKPPSEQISFGDLSSKISLGEIDLIKRQYLYSILYRNSRIRWKILKNLRDLILNLSNSSIALKEIDKYLLKYHWRKFKPSHGNYHRYWDRKDLKISLQKFLIEETLGLDVNILEFFKLDDGDSIELHHIFENRENIFPRYIVPLLVSSHKNLTFTDKYKTEEAVKISRETILQRKKELKKFSSLDFSKEIENFIRNQFVNNTIWKDMILDVKEQWVNRWKDKNTLTEQEWYTKYRFLDLYLEYNKTLKRLRKVYSSPDMRHKFIFWYFQYFLPNLK